MRIGAFTVVWQEARYLPLVLEQLLLCPGPKLLLWMDAPIFWLDGDYDFPPSGYASKVKDVVKELDPLHQIRHVLCQPIGDQGYLKINEIAYEALAKEDVEVVIRYDSDWIFTLDETFRLYDCLIKEEPSDIIRWNVEARHYWRNWNTIYADTGIGVAFRLDAGPDIWSDYGPHQYAKLPFTCYHPSYVWTDGEMLIKVNSWMHAPEFRARNFYENEWMRKDDIGQPWIKARPADIPLPRDVWNRLTKYKAWLPGQEDEATR